MSEKRGVVVKVTEKTRDSSTVVETRNRGKSEAVEVEGHGEKLGVKGKRKAQVRMDLMGNCSVNIFCVGP